MTTVNRLSGLDTISLSFWTEGHLWRTTGSLFGSCLRRRPWVGGGSAGEPELAAGQTHLTLHY